MKRISLTAFCLLAAPIFSVAFFAQEPQTPPPSSAQTAEQGGPDTIGGGTQDPAAAERGRKLFVSSCGFCHGPDARGRSGPDLVRSTLVLHDVKGNLIGDVLRTGRPKQGMPAFSFSAEQIADIAAFLHSKTHGAANRFTYVISGLLTGDANAGKTFFFGAGKCNTCHSPEKDLAHIASKYDAVELQSRLLSPPSPDASDLINKDIKPPSAVAVTIRLPSGQSVSGTLLDADAFDVALLDASGRYRSYPRDQVQLEINDPLKFHRDMVPKYTDKEMHNMLAYLETLK